uniref:Uncharacterized protein n=1 Tax=Utricularia reniformis TaxID=192314 RepID=A0A1Y0AZ46_9LAMI|nr:hypothetical protein AEK19_MT1716 [Utricularia reniformis]ART30399.1 hypothetical protein AEK19_MT1716 [Utricularia reniformis]
MKDVYINARDHLLNEIEYKARYTWSNLLRVTSKKSSYLSRAFYCFSLKLLENYPEFFFPLMEWSVSALSIRP